MNEYFKRTPDSFNYDNAQQGAGDLYDLRVATRDEIKRFENLIIDHKEWSLSVLDDVGNNASEIRELAKRIAELEQNDKIQDDDIEFNHQRILDLIAAGTVDHGKYAHLTELQLSGIIGVLKVYADYESWRVSKPGDKKPWFRNNAEQPWLLAREALSVLEASDD